MTQPGSSTMRYFVNKLKDFAHEPTSGQSLDVPVASLEGRVKTIIAKITENMSADKQNCDGGLYVGIAGISYALWYISQCSNFQDRKDDLLRQAKAYFDVADAYETHHQDKNQQSFLLGTAGVCTVGALVNWSSGDAAKAHSYVKRYAEFASRCQPVNFLHCGSDELFVGRAGYLAGAIVMAKRMGTEVLKPEVISSLCASIVQSGRQYARSHNSPTPLMYAYYRTEYLGAGHGLAGILQILLSFPDFVKSDAAVEGDIRASVDFMVKCQQQKGNVAPTVEECFYDRPAEHELVHWCHGSPGVVYTFAKAYQIWQDQQYLDACHASAELVWNKGLLKKGPGICHGVAGSGYVFLLLYRLTKDPKYLHRAVQFANFMETQEFQEGARKPDCLFSLFEGLAGTACFLVDLLQPEKAEFPLFYVF